MVKIDKQTLIVLGGCQFTGKTTMGDELRRVLNIPFLAVDRFRILIFGKSIKYHDDKEGDHYQLSRAYPAMRGAAEELLRLGNSLILEGSFSSKIHGQEKIILYLANKYKINLKVFLMEVPNEKVGEVIAQRAEQRKINGDDSGATTIQDYFRTKERFDPFEIPHLKIDSTKPFDECFENILNFICE